MKSSARRIDHLGRIVLPIDARRALDIHEGDQLDIYPEGNRIIVEKLQVACCFCNDTKNLTDFGGKRICAACLKQLKNL